MTTAENLAQALIEAPAARRAALLLRATGRPDVAEVLRRRAADALHHDARTAVHVARIARSVGRLAGDPRVRASTELALASAFHRTGHYSEAQRQYETAASGFALLGMDEERARVEVPLIDALFHVGKLAEAEALALRLEASFTRAGDHAWGARVLVNLANLRHAQDRHAEAIRLLERAGRALAAADDRPRLAAVQLNLANSWSLLARFDRSGPLYEQARRAYTELGQPVWAAAVDYNLAYDHFLQGRVHEARRLLAHARRAFRAEGAEHRLALAALDEAEMALAVARPARALEAAEEARGVFREVGDALAAARAALFGAEAARLLGDEARAQALLREAHATFARAGHRPGLASAGMLRAASPDVPAARRLASAVGAARTFAAHGLKRREAMALVLAGNVALEKRRPAAAHALLRKALATARRRRLPEVELRAQHTLGRVEEAAGRPGPALVRYRGAISAYERLRAGMRSDADRVAFASDKSVVFEDALRAALDLGRPAVAFDLVERARSRALADLLAADPRFAAATLRAGGALARRLTRVKGELTRFEARARSQERHGAAGAAPAAAAAMRRALLAHETAMERLADREPETSLALAGWPVVPLDDVRALLGRERALLAYFADGDRLGALLVTDRDVRAWRGIASQVEVEGTLASLHFLLDSARAAGVAAAGAGTAGAGPAPGAAGSRAAIGAANDVLADLFRQLLAPIETALGDRALVVVPTAALHHVPFHALSRAGRPLVQDREVTVAASATVLVQASRRRPRTRGTLVVSVPDAAAPEIAREAAAVAALTGARVLAGGEATAAALRREGPRARVLHLAAHGVYDAAEPLLSGLELADGRLTLPEVAALGLDAALVTLSACETGRGTPRGEEVLGLVRAFHAGSRALVASLWSVADASTAALMTAFHARLARGEGVGAALRAATLEVRSEHPHPYHRAPFVAVGAWDGVGTTGPAASDPGAAAGAGRRPPRGIPRG